MPVMVKGEQVATLFMGQFLHELPRSVRFLLRPTGALNRAGSNLASYLLFEESFCRALIDLGYQDTLAREAEVRDGVEVLFNSDRDGPSITERIVSELDAAGNTTTFVVDANGRELSRTWQRTDSSGAKVSVTTSKTYDAEGRVIAETDELGGVTKTAYNSAGQPISVTDPVGRVISYTYDSQGRQVKTTYPDGTSETTTFDAEGNRAATTDRAGRATTYSYDGQNRVTKTLHPDGTGDTVTYNAAGMTLATHDANGNPVAFKPGNSFIEMVSLQTTVDQLQPGTWKVRYYQPAIVK